MKFKAKITSPNGAAFVFLRNDGQYVVMHGEESYLFCEDEYKEALEFAARLVA